MKILAVFLLSVAMWASGCPTPESVAVKSLAANKGFIESEMGKHGECKPVLNNGVIVSSAPQASTKLCKAINDGIAAQHAAVLTLDAYCASDDYLTKGGQCSPPGASKADLQAKLKTAVGNLDSIVASIKSITNGGVN